MTVWLVRAGKSGDMEDAALEKGVAVVGWNELGDLSQAKTREELDSMYQKALPAAGDGRRANHVGQLWAFSHRIERGDLVVLPLKRSSAIAIGKVTGDYTYRTDLGSVHHIRAVEWIRTDIPRTDFDQDILYSFGAFMTVCRIHRNDAEARIKAVLAGKSSGPVGPKLSMAKNGDDDITDIETQIDIEQVARDQISAHILAKFKGHEMTRLVEAVLSAEGYITESADPGADGGVDILAASGPLGFSSPRLCVQVKSQQSAADVTVFRGLQGSMQTFSAEQGLLVCWGGFNKAVTKEARLSFFKIRLWDAGHLLEAVMRNYDRLPEELQAELPLKHAWTLVLED